EPLLHKIDSQHLLQSQRRPTIASLRGVGLDELQKSSPKHYFGHIFEKVFAPGFLLFVAVGKRCECWLAHSVSSIMRAAHSLLNLCFFRVNLIRASFSLS